MISEVPLGAFLSGGVDSSAVVAAMAGYRPTGEYLLDRLRGSRVRRVALCAAGRGPYRTRHFVDRVESDDFDLIDTLARLYDEPYRGQFRHPDLSGVPARAQARDGGAVGRRRRREFRRLPALPAHLDGGANARRSAACAAASGIRPARAPVPEGGLGAAGVPRQDDVRGAGARFGRSVFPRRVDPARRTCASSCSADAFKAQLAGTARSKSSVATRARARHRRPLALIQYLDLKTYLVGDINTKVDRASMAHSLEVREPLMDHPLVEWLATLPSSLKMQGRRASCCSRRRWSRTCRTTCCIGRRWASRCRSRSWFRGPLRERVREALLGARLADTGLFERDYLQQLVDAAPIGGARLQLAALDAAHVRGFLRNVDGRRPESGYSARPHESDHANPAYPRSFPAAPQRLRVPDARHPARTAALRLGNASAHDAEAGRLRALEETSTAGVSTGRRRGEVRYPGFRARSTSRRWPPTARDREVVEAYRPDILHAHSPVLNALPALWVGQTTDACRLRGARALGRRGGGPRHDTSKAASDTGVPRARDLRIAARGSPDDHLRGAARRDRGPRHSPQKDHRHPQCGGREAFRFGGEPDVELRKSLGLDGADVIGFAGSFYGYEGLDLLIDAVAL